MRKRLLEYAAVVRLVWPLALGMLNNALLQFVDRAFLSKESMESLEAVLPSSMLALVSMGFFQSVVAYSGTFVSQYSGAGKTRAVWMSYKAGTIIALFSGLLSIVLIPLGLAIVPWASANSEVISRARSYYMIVSAGAIALCGQMATVSFFTAQNKTRLVFYVNVLGNLLNVALDPIFIFGFGFFPRLGMAGAAIATVLAMFAQWAVLAFFAAKEKSRLNIGECETTLGEIIRKILRYGIPSGAYTVLNIVSFTIFVFVTGRVDDVSFAVSNACFSVNYLLIAPIEGFSIGASTLVAQAQGRRNAQEAKRALANTLFIALVFVAALSLLTLAFYRPILSLFAPSDIVKAARFYSLGFVLMVLMVAWQLFDATDVVISGALKGAGDTKFVMWWMVFVAFGIWLPLVWNVSVFYNTMPALWGTMIVYVAVICVGTIIRWRRGKWSRIKLV
ncbi:MAG: MATE family efflux transporter [Kiritimatiellae bacterium]|nr:MATE family efflux transporter [Kiritimatiellia bacterium]